jgi:hypothetical protein
LESFTIASASSNVWYGLIVTTGPKTSSRQTFISGVTCESSVGWKNGPSPVPPVSTSAPWETASSTHPRIRSTSVRWITGPTSTVGSIGSPTLSCSTCLVSRAAKSS